MNICAKIHELEILLAQGKGHPPGLRFFYFDIDYIFILTDESCGSFSWLKMPFLEYELTSYTDRGGVLGKVARLEALVNELLQLKLLGLCSESIKNSELLDEMLVLLDFPRKADLLERYGVIGEDLLRDIRKISKVRNVYAHNVMLGKAQLERGKNKGGKQSLADPQVFKEFKDILEQAFQGLVLAFQRELKKHDVETYVNTLIDNIKNFRNQSFSE